MSATVHRLPTAKRRRVEAPDRNSWTTPARFAELVTEALGGRVDLDPCGNPRSKIGAALQWTERDDGLVQDWRTRPGARIYCNPPFAKPLPWARLCLDAAIRGCFAVGCFKVDTSTLWWRECVWKARAIAFPFERVRFDPPPGVEASTPNFAVAFPLWASGPACDRSFRRAFERVGRVIQLGS